MKKAFILVFILFAVAGISSKVLAQQYRVNLIVTTNNSQMVPYLRIRIHTPSGMTVEPFSNGSYIVNEEPYKIEVYDINYSLPGNNIVIIHPSIHPANLSFSLNECDWIESYYDNLGIQSPLWNNYIRIQTNVSLAEKYKPLNLTGNQATYCDGDIVTVEAPCFLDKFGNYNWYVKEGVGGAWNLIKTGKTINIGIDDLYNPSFSQQAKYDIPRYLKVCGGACNNFSESGVSNSITYLPSGPQITTPAITSPQCTGGNDGSIVVPNTTGLALDYVYTLTQLVGSPGSFSPGVLVYQLQTGGNNQAVTLDATVTDNQSLPIQLSSGYWELSVGNGAGATSGCDAVSILYIPDRPELQITSLVKSIYTTNGINYNILCKGGTDEITINAIGGTPPYYYSIDNGATFTGPQTATSHTFTGLTANTYQVVVKDANDCSPIAAKGSITLSEPSSLVAFLTNNPGATCKNNNDGTLEFLIAGGAVPYTLNLTGPVPQQQTGITGTANFPNLIAGTYNLTVTDLFNCVTTINNIIVTEPDELLITNLQSTPLSCFGGSDGTIFIQVTGGTAISGSNYTYSIRHLTPAVGYSDPLPIVQGTALFTGLPLGNYEVEVLDDHGCSVMNTIQVTQPSLMNIAITTVPVVCKNGSDGQAIATLTGGIGPYTIEWLDSNNSVVKAEQTSSITTATGLSAGSYTLRVKDSNGCTNGYNNWLTASTTITEPAFLSIFSATTIVKEVTCSDRSDGEVEIMAGTGGLYPYTVTVDGIAKTVNSISDKALFIGLLPGVSYDILIQDANGCANGFTENFILPIPIRPSVTMIVPFEYGGAGVQVSCPGESDGSVTVETIGGVYPHKVTVNNVEAVVNSSADQAVFSGLSAGITYAITIEDVHSCVSTTNSSFVLSAGDRPIVSSMVALEYAGGVHVSCPGAADGEITLKTTGGIYPHTLEVNGVQATVNTSSETALFTGLSAGVDYPIRITDVNGCTSAIDSIFSLTEATDLVITGLDATAYFGGYNVTCPESTDGEAIISTTGGIYPHSVLVNGIIQIVNNSTEQISYSGLSAQAYSVVIKDANGCLLKSSITLTAPAQVSLNAVLTTTTSPACFSDNTGSLQLTAQDGVPIDGLRYRYVIEHLNLPAGLPFPFDQVQEQEGASADFTGLIAGTYAVRLYDHFGCIGLDTVSILTTSRINLDLTATAITCKGEENGSAIARLSGGTPPYTVIWQDWQRRALQTDIVGEGVASTLNARGEGMHYLRVIDGNGCEFYQANFGFEIRGPQYALHLTAVVSPISCADFGNGQVLLKASGGWQQSPYKFGRDKNNLGIDKDIHSGLEPGAYMFYVADASGCMDSLEVEIVNPEMLIVSLLGLEQPTCNGAADGTFSLQVQGGTPPYGLSLDEGKSWVTNDIFTGLTAGAYQVQIRDDRGCSTAIAVMVTEPDQLGATITNLVDTKCQQGEGSITIKVQGGTEPYTYTWYQGDTVIGSNPDLSNLYAGGYKVEVIDSRGCQISVSATIINTNAIAFEVAATKEVSCYGGVDGSAKVTVTTGVPPYEIMWSDGQTNQEAIGLAAGVYTVTVIDGAGCTDTGEVKISSPIPLQMSIIEQTLPACFQGCDGRISVAVLGGVAPYTYQWNAVIGNSNMENLCAGSYAITVTDAKGCTYVQTVVLEEAAPVEVHLEPEVTLCGGQQLALDGAALSGQSGNTSTYHWQSANGFESKEGSVTLSNEDTYTLTVTDGKGCVGSGTMVLKIRNDLLEADFVMPSEAYVGDTTVIVEISYPVPDRISWHYEEGITYNSVSYDVQELHFEKAGTYTVTLEAGLGDCRDELSKQITIYNPEDKGNIGGKLGYEEKGIKEIVIYPNPNDGVFKVSVVLEQVSSAKIRVISVQGDKAIASQQKEGSDAYEFDFNLKPSQPGVYLLVVEAGGETKIIRIVMN
jgi:hypothetical protein